MQPYSEDKKIQGLEVTCFVVVALSLDILLGYDCSLISVTEKIPEDQWSCKRSPETRDIYQ